MLVYIETIDRNFTSSKKYEVYSIHVDPKTCETLFLYELWDVRNAYEKYYQLNVSGCNPVRVVLI